MLLLIFRVLKKRTVTFWPVFLLLLWRRRLFRGPLSTFSTPSHAYIWVHFHMHARVWTHKALAFAYHQGSSGFPLSVPSAPSSMGEAMPSVPGGLKGSMSCHPPPPPPLTTLWPCSRTLPHTPQGPSSRGWPCQPSW